MTQDASILLQGLAHAKQQLIALERAYATNNAILRAAPHGSDCASFKRSRWHYPQIMDKITGLLREAKEADCDCWKRTITVVDAVEQAQAPAPVAHTYNARIEIQPVDVNKFDFFMGLVMDRGFVPGMGDLHVSGQTDFCTRQDKSYADLVYRMMTLIGELKLQNFRVAGYTVAGVMLDVRVA